MDAGTILKSKSTPFYHMVVGDNGTNQLKVLTFQVSEDDAVEMPWIRCCPLDTFLEYDGDTVEVTKHVLRIY